MEIKGIRQYWTTLKMSSLFAAVTNEEIPQIIEEAVPNKQQEGDKIQC